jgi:hypothetical protein
VADHVRCPFRDNVSRRGVQSLSVSLLHARFLLSAVPRTRRTARREKPDGLGGRPDDISSISDKYLRVVVVMQEQQKTRANEEIYMSLSRCLRSASGRQEGNYRHLVSTPILQLEFAPYINRIISPPLRPVCLTTSSLLYPF